MFSSLTMQLHKVSLFNDVYITLTVSCQASTEVEQHMDTYSCTNTWKVAPDNGIVAKTMKGSLLLVYLKAIFFKG